MTPRKLLRHRRVHLLHRSPHVLTGFLERVELRLLFRRQHRANLRHGLVDDRLSLLHRILMNCDDLWFRLIEQWLNLGLLVGRQVQRFRQMLHGKLVSAKAMTGSADPLRIHQSKATQRNRARCRESQ